MSVINTNITSMIGQSNLTKSQNALQTSMERLSSGLRINSAKDDAAGQAIANRMTAQITGLAQAQRNANDGISVAQTAEGALNQVNDNLQRIRELTVQAANGTNSAEDKQSIQDEINQRLSEIDRISKETSFNGVNVLASDQRVKIQVGANDGEAITVNLQEINSKSLKLDDFNVNGQVRNDVANASALNAAGYVQNSDGAFVGSENMAAKLSDLEALVGSGLSDIGSGQFATATANSEASIANFVAGANDAAGGTITIDGAVYTSQANSTFTSVETLSPAEAVTAAQADLDVAAGTRKEITVTGGTNAGTAWVDEVGNLFTTDVGGGDTSYGLTDLAALMADDGATFTDGTVTYLANAADVTRTETSITEIQMGAAVAASTTTVTSTNGFEVDEFGVVTETSSGDQAFWDSAALTTSNGGAGADATVYTVSSGNVTQTVFSSGAPVGTEDQPVYIDADETGIAALTTETGGERTYFAITNEAGTVVEYNTAADGSGETAFVDDAGFYTRDEFTPDADAVSGNPLEALDKALNQVDSLRSELGAVQNRFEDAITNLSTNATNLSAARSRIEDADYAVEVANMTRAQILQQAGTSVLAQANQIPQNVLSLLG